VQKIIHQGDALKWLEAQDILPGCSFITSLPDFSEFPKLSIEEWKIWWGKAAALIFARCAENGVVIFYQRDSKHNGTWIDKGYLCQKAAEAAGFVQLWHKIVARGGIGNPSFGRPGYSHLLCFSKNVRAAIPRSTADILPEAGPTTWTRGMGLKACEAACKFVLEQTETRTIVDPFCGHGTVLAVANQLGLDAIGVELGARRAERARELTITDLEARL
jgi:hypothetical protein